MKTLKLGLALGSGGARGWAHIGILRALEAMNLRPDVVCGVSSGSLVGAAYASGQLDVLEEWIRKLRWLDVLTLFDTTLGRGGFIEGSKLMTTMANRLKDQPIESLPIMYGAIATDLHTGGEVWLREGSMLSAVRASSGLPGLFVPVRQGGRWLIDGGVVNPVPVSLCHALGADLVVAVNLNTDALDMHRQHRDRDGDAAGDRHKQGADGADPATRKQENEILERIGSLIGNLMPNSKESEEPPEPSLFDVLASTIAIMQDRITRSRMAGEPPEVQICPRLGDMQILDFHKAGDAIEEGRRAVARAREELLWLRGVLGRRAAEVDDADD